MILDAHCHVWPDAIAATMVAGRPAGLTPVGDGTVAGLLRSMDDAGVDMACALGIAVQARHVRSVNAFIGGLDRQRLIPVGTVHVGLSPQENLQSLQDNGIAGVKFHPNFQGTSLVDPATLEIFAALAGAGIPVLAHIGHGDDDAAGERGHSRHVATVLDAVPDLQLVAFHFGGYHDLGAAESVLADPRVRVETSWPPSVAQLGAQRIRRMITRHGTERVVFGSDWPMASQADELATIRSLGLVEADERAVLGGNLARLFGLAETRGPVR